MSDLLVIVLVGLGTLALRAAFLVRARPTGPAAGAGYLHLVAPAVLAAITVPALLAPRGTTSLAETVPSLIAAAVALVVWRRTHSFPVPLLAGLMTWWGVLALISLW
jgi:branched-subunit amino acid transport protein